MTSVVLTVNPSDQHVLNTLACNSTFCSYGYFAEHAQGVPEECLVFEAEDFDPNLFLNQLRCVNPYWPHDVRILYRPDGATSYQQLIYQP